jgi:hypothetical protein
MSKNFEQGRDEIGRLCDLYLPNRDTYRGGNVTEDDVRQSLIDRFFEALGWDVRNTAMVAPQYREVVPNKSLEREAERKVPDYTFRVGQTPKFFVEAKKCSVNIGADGEPAYQLRRYGWSAKVALSLLCNFEEVAVYDCTRRPNPTDKASRARILILNWREYQDRWRDLWDVFSREAVWSGAFDHYAESKRKRGTSEVDAEFLKEIEHWREALARNIAARNTGLAPDDLNAAVQLTIDRVIFLRMAEDRGLEPYQQLLKLCDRAEVYARFMRDLCRRADEKYNAGLFHFDKEPGVAEAPDRITPRLAVDDKVFKPLLQGLYYEHGSPYRFDVMPVEILGTIYERFLGKVVRLTAGHQAKVEEKPEVRKAGGVYYTPAYIVQYIVQETVGRQVRGRSPMQLAGQRNGKQPFRVLDMACGSGSFLLGAYQYLLDHCLKWYTENRPERHKGAVWTPNGEDCWKLTLGERKRILTTHIFGVDIDPQAVEVSKLSLLLKVLEAENDRTLLKQAQLRLFQDRALPNLADNVQCGNSLIGPDYFRGKLPPAAEELKSVSPFDWTRGFPAALGAGGFDCIIGNPPYYKLSGQAAPEMMNYFRERYTCASYKTEFYALFAEKSLALLKSKGVHSYVVPNSFLAGVYLEGVRRLLAERNTLLELVLLKDVKVFQDAKLDSVVYVVSKHAPEGDHRMLLRVANRVFQSEARQVLRVRVREWRRTENREFRVVQGRVSALLAERIEKQSHRLGNLASVHLGLVLESNSLLREERSRKSADPIILGRDISRYHPVHAKRYFSFAHDQIVGGTKEPRVYAAGPRIVLQAIRNLKLPQRLVATVIPGGVFTMGTVHNVIVRDDRFSIYYLLGILNSRLLNEYYAGHFPEHRIKGKYLESLPIASVDWSQKTSRSKYDRMVELVTMMVALHRQSDGARSVRQRETLQHQIDTTDAAIDRLVFDLYGLTEGEIAIVEGAAVR